MKNATKAYLFLFLLVTAATFGQTNYFWQTQNKNQVQPNNLLPSSTQVNEYSVFQLNESGFIQALSNAPKRFESLTTNVTLSIPYSGNKFGQFEIFEVETLAPALASNYPGIKSYVGRNTINPTERLSITVTPTGVHAKIFASEGSINIDPMTTNGTLYKVYNTSDATISPFNCEFEADIEQQAFAQTSNSFMAFSVDDATLRTYRFAVATTGEYSDYHINQVGIASGTDAQKKAAVLAAMTVSLDRVNSILENDLAIRLQFIPNTDDYIFLDSSTDPYTSNLPIGSMSSTLLNENIAYFGSDVPNADYDIGHLFNFSNTGFGAGGIAGLGSLCSNGSSKAAGVTQSGTPEGEGFDLVLAHEIGHQLGATHSYNNSCAGNRTDSTAFETGSGVTIMAYAGICAPNVVTNNNKFDHYHATNIIQMFNHINNNATCGQTSGIANTPPVLTPLTNYTIPKSTPFVLDVQATDADALTYNWEQYDNEISTQPPLPTATDGPSFRGYDVSTSSERYFPRLEDVLIGEYEPLWEVLPGVARDINFIVTVRDNNALGGQVVQETNTLTVDDTAGPFRVTSQAGQTFFWETGSTVDITWDVANTANPSGVNSQIVDIYLSTDGGATFNTLLAANTPNNGSQTITVPSTLTSNARVMVRSADNVFFDINEATIEITDNLVSCLTPQNISLDHISPNTASISWLDASEAMPAIGYDYYLVTDGSVPDGTTSPTNSFPSSTTSTVFNGLTSNTSYDFYIRSNCGTGNLSNWSSALNFTTDCDAISAPFVENFDGASWSSGFSSDILDSCWKRTPDNPFDNYGWRVRSGAAPSSSNTGPTTDVSGTGNYILAHASGHEDYAEAIFETPRIDLSTLSIPNMKFSYHMFGGSMGTLKVQVKEISSATYTDLFTINGQQQSTSTDPFIEETIDLNAYANQTINIRFLAIRGENFNSDIAIDEVKIEETSECAVVENLISSNETLSNFDLSWDSISAALNGYEWVVMADGVAPDPTSAVQTGTVANGITTATITGLTSQTDYDVYVRADCSGLGLGNWSDVLEINLDYCEAGAVSNTNIHFTNVTFNTIDNNSTNGTNGAGYSDYSNISTSVNKLQGYDLNISANFYGANVRLNVWIDYNQNGVFTDSGEHVVVNLTDTAIQSPGVITIPVTANLGSTIMRLRVENADPNFPFLNNTPCGDAYFSEVEDYTLIIEENCLAVENLVATNTTLSSFDLAWDSSPTEVNGYEWLIMADGIAPDPTNAVQTGTVTTGTTNVSISGLTSNTNYDVYVRADCDGLGLGDWSDVLDVNLYYCAVDVEQPATIYISNTTFNNINNNSSDGINGSGYSDYTGVSTTVNIYETYQFSVNTNLNNGNSRVNVWIDFNQNGIFTDAGEQVITNITGATPYVSNISIPPAVSLGSTTMRVRMDNTSFGTFNDTPCGSSSLGEVEDYTIIIEENCLVVENLVATNTTLSSFDLAWDSSPTEVNGYEWVVMADGIAPDPTNAVQTGTVASGITTVQITGLTSNTDYDVYVRANCGGLGLGDWSAVLEINLDYCEAGASGFDNIHFTNVAFNTIDNSSSFGTNGAGYSDYTNISTMVSKLQGYNLNTSANFYGPNVRLNVWIDYNQNGVFTDAGEHVIIDLTDTAIQNAGVITIPATANLGSTVMRMRIENADPNFSPINNTPCGDGYLSEVEDYTIIITDDCFAPTNVAISNINNTTADLAWDAETTASGGYEWVVMADGEDPDTGTPVNSGSVTTGTTANIAGLISSTNYDVYIRSNCGSGTFSQWSVAASFTTLSCEAPTNLIITNVTNTTADLTWDAAVTAAAGYDYVVLTSGSAAPIETTTPTGNVTSGVTMVNLMGLSSGISYDVYVRSNCGSGNLSDWSVAASFITLSLTSNVLDFDGTNDYIDFGTNVLSTATALTIETWYNPGNDNKEWSRILDFGNNTNQYMFLTSSVQSTDRPLFAITNAGINGAHTISAPSGLALNTWSHIAVSLSGTTATMYINGIQVSQNTNFNLNPSDLGSTTNNWLGRSQFSADSYLNGKLDDLRIWNVARTAAEIQNNLNAELLGNESGLVAYYTFDEGNPGADNTGIASPEIKDVVCDNDGIMNGFAKIGTTSNWVTASIPVTDVTQVTQAEINVQAGNPLADIPNGSTTFSITNSTDFGEVSNGSNEVLSYTIQNTAAGSTLTVADIVVGGANSADFVVSSFTNNTTITGNATTTFDLTFTPSSLGLRNATITINNDDCDEGVYDYAVQGTGVISCTAPTNLAATNITNTTATLAWDAEASASNGYEWVLMANGISPDTVNADFTGTVGMGINTVNFTGLSENTTYDAYVRSNCGGGTLSDWSVVLNFTSTTSPVVNDICTGAESITVTTSQQTISFDTSDAQVNLEEGCEGSAQASYVDVWYSFEMPAAGNIQISSAFLANNFAIYDSCGGTEISCFPQQNLIEDLTPGITYWIRMFRPSSQAASGGQAFSIRLLESETNDTCTTAENITLNVGNATPTNFSIGGADIINEAACSVDTPQELLDVWYKFTMPVTGNVFINTASTVNNFAVYDACGGTEISCFNKTNLVEGLTANTEYYVRVFRQKLQASIGTFDFTIEPFAATTNDTCGTADVITLIEGSTVSQNFTMGGSDIILEEGCEGTTAAEYIDIWYEFTMPVDGTLTISSVLNVNQYAIYDSCGINNTQLSCSQQSNTTGLSQGQTYYLRVFKNKLQAGLKSTEMSISVTGCNSPENLTASNITQNSAVLTWDASTSTNQGYDYVLITDGSSPDFSTLPTGNISVGITTVDLQSLSIGTTYDAYVRTNCGNGDFSDWSPVESFTTLTPCIAPTNLSVSNITQNSANLSWGTGTNESGGYDYVLFTDNSVPDGSTLPTGSTGTGVTAVNLTGLNTDTVYSAYVRTNCGNGNFSGWSAVESFTTLPTPSVGLNFDGGNDHIVSGAVGVQIKEKTLMAWVKLDNVDQQGGGLVNLQTPNGVSFDAIVYNEQIQGHGWGFGSENFNRTSWSGIKETSTSEWIHIAATYEDNNYKIYRNGVVIHTETSYAAYQFAISDVTNVGERHNGATHLDASIDEVSVWGRALCDSEIIYYMNKQLGGNEDDLVLYYDFEEGVPDADNTALPNTVIDKAGTNNGTMVGFTKNGNSSNWVSGVGFSNQITNAIPEINVQAGNPLTDISSGSTAHSSANNTDFGNVDIGSSKVLNYTIQNTIAGSDLTITDIVVSGTNGGDFVVSNFTNNTVVTGIESTSFDVSFTASAIGTSNATITINNNDCNEGAYDFAIRGTTVPLTDNDNDGVFGSTDLDDDNDGILDTVEDANTDNDNDPSTNPTDTDGDTIPNYLDLDSDNDGIPDNVEAQSTFGYKVPTADSAETYGLNNGVNSAYLGGLNPVDTEGDGVLDYLDGDSDNDGTSDLQEGLSTIPTGAVGINGLMVNAETLDDYSDVNGIAYDGTQFNLLDTDNDVSDGADYDYRDIADLEAEVGTFAMTSFSGAGTPISKANAYINIVANNWGVVITRVNGVAAISNPVEGMIVFDTIDNTFKVCTQGGTTAPTWRALRE